MKGVELADETSSLASESSSVKFEGLNPFSKLTKGLQSVVKRSKEQSAAVESVVPVSDFGLDTAAASIPRSASSDYMTEKVAEAASHTKVLLL